MAALCLLSIAGAAWGSVKLGLEANPADLQNPRAYLVNPTLSCLGQNQAGAGYRLLHTGLLDSPTDLNTGYLFYTGRHLDGGMSFGYSYVATPLSSERQFSLGYGRRIWNGFAVGGRLGFEQRGFNSDRFELAQTNDPLLSGSLSKTTPLISCGLLYAQPFSGISFALVIDDPHRPNISLDGKDTDARLPMVVRAGASFERPGLQAGLSLLSDSDEGLSLQMRGIKQVYGVLGLIAGYRPQALDMGMRIAATEYLSFDYDYSLPQGEISSASAGSHTLSVWFQAFDLPPVIDRYRHREPVGDTYIIRPPSAPSISFPRPPALSLPELSTESDLYFAEVAIDTVRIRTKRLNRIIDPRIDHRKLAHYPRWYAGVMDSTWSGGVTISIMQDVVGIRPQEAQRKGNYSTAYMEGIKGLGQSLSGGDEGRLNIVAGNTELDRALYLGREVAREADVELAEMVDIYEMSTIEDSIQLAMLFEPIGPDTLLATEELTLLELESIPFPVHVLGEAGNISSWSLEISDSDDEPVRLLAGGEALPDTIFWDWLDQEQRLVPPDVYNFRLSWQKPSGAEINLPPQEFLIIHETHDYRRRISYKFDPEELDERGATLILDPGYYIEAGREDRTSTPEEESAGQ